MHAGITFDSRSFSHSNYRVRQPKSCSGRACFHSSKFEILSCNFSIPKYDTECLIILVIYLGYYADYKMLWSWIRRYVFCKHYLVCICLRAEIWFVCKKHTGDLQTYFFLSLCLTEPIWSASDDRIQRSRFLSTQDINLDEKKAKAKVNVVLEVLSEWALMMYRHSKATFYQIEWSYFEFWIVVLNWYYIDIPSQSLFTILLSILVLLEVLIKSLQMDTFHTLERRWESEV